MYILLISSWFPSHENPSYGSFVFEQAELLMKMGHRVEVVQPVLSGSAKQTWRKGAFKSKTDSYLSIPVHYISVNVWLPGMKWVYYRFLYKKCLTFLESHFSKSGKPAIFHSHAAFMGGIITAQLSSHFGIPMIHTEHTSGFIFDTNQYTQTDLLHLSKLTKKSKKNLFVSHFAKESTQEKTGVSIPNSTVLPNLVHHSFFSFGNNKSEGNISLCIGNFSPIKNQLFLLDVWKRVVQVLPDALLVFAGDGFENPSFEQKLHESGLISHIKVLPRLSREEVVSTMSKCKMVLSASRVETFGLTLAEALAMGIPVVATDSGGPRDIITPGDGFLIHQGDTVGFTEAVLNIFKGIHAPSEEISRSAQARFGEKETYKRLLEVYQKALV